MPPPMRPQPIDLPALCRDLLKIVEDFENPHLQAHAKADHSQFYKDFAAAARPLLEGALKNGLTEPTARRILMGMKHLQLSVKGDLWQSNHGNVPDFIATKTRLADALEHSQIPQPPQISAASVCRGGETEAAGEGTRVIAQLCRKDQVPA